MAMQKSKKCRECGRRTLHAKETFSDGWGCVLTLMTGGLFLPIWFLLALLAALRPWRCQTCGSTN